MNKKLLLISNSTSYGSGYLDHVEHEIKIFLEGIKRILFVPYASHDLDGYAAFVEKRFYEMGFETDSIHKHSSPKEALQNAEACFVGGGNTFRLLDGLYKNNLLELMHEKVAHGMPYIGTSAGANVACIDIKTTNDMPIIYPQSFNAFNLVPFNINPHYIDVDSLSTHMGEGRDQRIVEFLEENNNTVVALREGTMLLISGDHVTLKGSRGAKIFQRGLDPEEYIPECQLDFLLSESRKI